MSSSSVIQPTPPGYKAKQRGITPKEKKTIFASSIGTAFEWYDFYLYAALAPFFATLFFPPGNEMAALLAVFATYAVGFIARPFGALIFGVAGDMLGRKYTFILTLIIMGVSTIVVGIIPTFETIGWAAPILLVAMRCAQGLALGGEYGGAVIYIAEHTPSSRRGFATSWIQTTATLGVFVALVVIYGTSWIVGAEAFNEWGWRIPFLSSAFMLGICLYIRMRLNESPVFLKMQEEDTTSKAPIRESFFKYPNNKHAFLALFGAVAGQGVVWHTGQFYALYFMTIFMQVDMLNAYILSALAMVIGTPMFIYFGWLSDRVGRLKIILTGCALGAIMYFPLFNALSYQVNPDLMQFKDRTRIVLNVDSDNCNSFVGPWSEYTDCDHAKDFLSKKGLSIDAIYDRKGPPMTVKIGDDVIDGWNEDSWSVALKQQGYPEMADPQKINTFNAVLILAVMYIFTTMVYGPLAAWLVELFPAKVRYTSISLPYHIGNGCFAGVLPMVCMGIAVASGNIYAGLWYPVIIAGSTVIIGSIFLRNTKKHD